MMQPLRSWAQVELGTEARPFLVRWSTSYAPRAAADGPGLIYESYALRAAADGRGLVYESYALRTAAGPVVVDPAEPAQDGEAQVCEAFGRLGGRPAAILLTNAMHERGAYLLRQRWAAPVWAPASGRPEYEGEPDRFYGDGDLLPGGLRAFQIGGHFPGDSCLLWTAADGTRVFFTGDVIMGRQPDHPARQSPLHVTAPDTTSLRRLVDEDFDLLCPAHGLPHRNDPKALLARLLTATEGHARKGRP